MTSITVTHRDGTRVPYNADMINRSLERACRGLSDPVSKVTQIASETELTLYNGITTDELDQATIQAAVQNIKDDPEYDVVAKRLLLKTIYRKVIDAIDNDADFVHKHRDGFVRYIRAGVADGMLDPRLTEAYDLGALAAALDTGRDEHFKYIGLVTIQKRYAILGPKQKPLETPQYTWMRIAMGLALADQNPQAAAVAFYNKMSRLEYIPGGSVNIHAGTKSSQMSNCYVMEMHDSINHIAKTVSDVMKLTKATGGIGLSVTKLRAEGSPVHSNNTFSSGPIPFMHTIDSTLRAVSRAGKKMGALAFYMENWHYNIGEFIDLKENAGDEYRRTRTANTAVYLSDEFMKRVNDDAEWYLFDPAETPDLNELYGEAFSARYNEYVRKAEAGEMNLFKKVRAREQFRTMLISLQTTAHPWITFKDPMNVRALNNNTGTIHLSNLCTEICLPQDKNNIAVCNLTSINLSRHLTVSNHIDWEQLKESVRLAVRQLDNLLDVNKSPLPETDNSDRNNRAVGLGVMGFTDVIQRMGLAYDSEEAYDFADKLFEFFSYHAIDESANLARERGSYPNFPGSRWSQGMVPFDTVDELQRQRGRTVTMNRGFSLDWNALREKVRGGMRNATVMAIAPTANIGLVAGTTPGIDPVFANIFARATNRGKFLEINENLVSDLKKLGMWDQAKDQIVAHHGEVDEVPEIPEQLKRVYKTSFQLSPYAFIEVASRAQKWIDQALSRNMYLQTRDIDDMVDIYSAAWEKGLKTTYYLHVKQRHSAEQSTSKVNKSQQLSQGRRFGFGKSAGTPAARPVREPGSGLTAPMQQPAQQPQTVPHASQQPAAQAAEPQHVAESTQPADTVETKRETITVTAAAAAQVTIESSGSNVTVREEHAGFQTFSEPLVPAKGFNAVRQVREQLRMAERQPTSPSAPQPGIGFGAARPQSVEPVKSHKQMEAEKLAAACPVDPIERMQCDSCQ